MLILTRRTAQTLYIGDEVTVTILGVIGNQVRLGIQAPRHVQVDREEIYQRKKAQRAAAGEEGESPESEALAEVNGNR